ncbi:MAG: hypothetical protein HY553_07340, partial [Elusimicrobia bacterium]|nr:hypothetical protein [Elusimicrobiota bacterium]
MREEEERKGPRAPVIPTWVAAANGPGGAWAIRLGAAVGSSFATPAGVAALVIYGAVAATTLGLVFGARLRLAAGLTPGLSFAWPAKPGARTAWGKGAAGAAGAATDDPAVSGSLDAFRAANREALAEGSSATESAAAAAAQDPGAEGSA